VPQAPDRGVAIDVDSQGKPYVANDEGVIYRADAEGNNWSIVADTGGASDISISPFDKLWKVSRRNSNVYSYASPSWTKESTSDDPATTGANEGEGNNAKRISVSSTVAWTVNSSNKIWKYSKGIWSEVPGTAKDISVGAESSVFIITSVVDGWKGSSIHALTRIQGADSWQNLSVDPVAPTNLVRVTADKYGQPWVIDVHG
jgi:hypothetical protein